MNNDEKIERIKSIISDFDKLVKDKQRLNNELVRTQIMLSESNKIIKKLNYEVLNENDETLLSEIEKQKSYINTINEIASNFNQINNEISKYDESKLGTLNDYILLAAEFNRLCEEIKIVEKLSKKSGEQKVETRNAEGRKKLIDIDLIDYYNELALKKKQISRQVLNNYKILNDLDVDQLIIDKPVQENISYQTIEPKKEYYPENIIKNMTLDEKIHDAEDKMQRIINTCYLPNQGKKRYVKFGNQHYSMPVKYVGRFNNLKGELNKLMEIKKEEQNLNVSLYNIKQEKEEIQELVDFDKQFDNIMKEISEMRARVIEERRIAEQIALYDIKSEESQENFKDQTVNQENKNLVIKKINKKKDIIKKIKKVAITVTATAMIAVTAISGLNVFKQKNNKGNQNDISKKIVYDIDSELEKNVDVINNNSETIEIAEVRDNSLENKKLEQEDILLPNEKINIEAESEIYKTANDATNKENGLNPYYNANMERNVVGITIKMPNDEMITIKNYDLEQITNLINQGGQITAYLTGNQLENGTYDYEGYYNVDDIEKESGGKSR